MKINEVCRRSLDPVPTEVSVPLITKSTHTYRKELDFLTFTPNEKCWFDHDITESSVQHQIQSLIIHIKDPTPLYNFNYFINTNIYNNEFFKENQFKRKSTLYRGQLFYLVLNASFNYIVVEETTDLTQSHWQTYFKDEVSRRTLFDLILKTDHTEEEFDNTKGVIKIKPNVIFDHDVTESSVQHQM
jgi:hypothetical protein